MFKAILLLIASFVIAGPSITPAYADFESDKRACIYPGQDFDGEIAACDRQVTSGRYRGNDRAIVYRNRGIKFMNRWSRSVAPSDVALALTDFSRAIEFNPRYADAYVSRGKAYAAKNDLDLALSDYSEAIRIDPRNVAGFTSRGDLHRVRGDGDRAIADFSDAIRLDAKNGFAYRNRGFVYGVKGDDDRAIADYGDAIRIDPRDALARNNRGNILLKKKQFDRAITDLSEAIKLDPSFGAAYANRGLAQEALGKPALARNDFTVALTLPEKYANGKWARDKARERLAALEGTSTAPSAVPSTSTPPSSIKIPSIASTVPTAPSAAPPGASGPAAVAPVIAAAAPTATLPLGPRDRRIALVIGNSAYSSVSALTNPRRDAALVADTLKKTGFSTVTVLTDLRKDALMTALREFAVQAEAADWAVVYYAGHGMEVGGVNYLIPVDARIAVDRDIEFEAVPLGQILNAAERAKKLRLVILDACRNNPFANKMKRTLEVASRSTSQGLAAVEPEAGTMVVYAAKDGEVALDGAGANSPFATALVKNLPTPGLEVRRLFDYVRDDVMDLTKRKQKPFSYGSISGRQDFYFVAAK
ncbi:caspase family protein [Tardiphaga sp.]|jgi:tetratricopeptide (TPR) repeat protein|uniref:caspase family protein n=1 Tax=Tardiphaga sp. TaxID=1926292 RepID=UPI0037D9E613